MNTLYAFAALAVAWKIGKWIPTLDWNRICNFLITFGLALAVWGWFARAVVSALSEGL